MQRLFLPLALLAAPPATAQDNPFCTFALQACDYDREEAGACPKGSAATATIYPEGEHWYLDATGLTSDPAEGPSATAELLNLAVAGDTADGTKVYYIVDRAGLDGALLLAPDGAAHLALVGDAGPAKTRFSKTYTGTCEVIQP